MKYKILLLLPVLSLALSLSARDITRYVKLGGTGNGTSWGEACGSIQKAVNDVTIAGSGTIHIAAGTYYESVRTGEKHDQLTMLGGYPASGDGVRNPKVNKTIIDGKNTRVCLLIGHMCRKTLIDGFYMRNGGSGSIPMGSMLEGHDGGGITVEGTDCIIRDCQISNTGTYYGIHIVDADRYSFHTELDGDVLVEDCSVYKCGGGIMAKGATIKNCIVNGNKGYGIHVTDCDVYHCNSYDNNGTGVATNGSCLLSNCSIYNNLSTKYEGGGVYVNGNTTVFGSAIYNNTSSRGGGFFVLGELVLESSTVVNNKASIQGGGICTEKYNSSQIKVAGSILWHNKCKGVNCEFTLIDCQYVKFFRCGIEGGGELPETDEENGIINLAIANKDIAKPSVCFVKVANIVGASRVAEQIVQIKKQDFKLGQGSACIGTGGYFSDVKIRKDKLLDGTSYTTSNLNMGAFGKNL